MELLSAVRLERLGERLHRAEARREGSHMSSPLPTSSVEDVPLEGEVEPLAEPPFARATEITHSGARRSRRAAQAKNVSSSEYGGEHMQRRRAPSLPATSSCQAPGGISAASPVPT
jgi:hypothetical protein